MLYGNLSSPYATASAVNVSTLGTTTSNAYYAGSSIDAVLYDGCLVFWRSLGYGNWNLTAFNLTSRTFTDVYTSQDQNWPTGSAPACENGGFVIDNALYTGYSWQNEVPPFFTSTVIYTRDLATFNTLGNVNMSLESMCEYTGGDAYGNTIYFGGYQSMGQGTYSQIDRWHDGTDQLAWNGTIFGSDDVCFLTMFNSTCMIGSDCAPNNIIYTNDGVNFVDEWSPDHLTSGFTSQYPYVWAWGCDVDSTSGTAYIVASASIAANYYGYYSGGMATWTGAGTYTPTLWDPINLYTVSNGLVGGSDNYLDKTPSWTGHPAIYAYNSSGGMVSEVWQNPNEIGAVLSLIYSTTNAWYGLCYDTLTQEVTILGIGKNSIPSPPKTIVVPDDYPTIDTAIDAANPGDTVYVRPGTYRENVQVDQTLSLVGENPESTFIDGDDVLSVVSILADHVTVTGFTITEDETASQGTRGYADIALSASSCNISGNTLTSSFAGVDLSGSANDNSIIGNKIVDNDWGIYIGAHDPTNANGVTADNNAIRNNITNNDEGIGIGNLACGNIIAENDITANSAGLLLFEASHDNTIVENTVDANAVGVNFETGESPAYDNLFYHNNFVNNALQVVGENQANVWDIGYPSGGNYWSDYKGTDFFKGPNQNQTGSDGIGDTPLVIYANSKDNYPLMAPFISFDGISIVSNSIISNVQITEATLSFDVTGPPGTSGFCTMMIPDSTLGSPYLLTMDGNQVPYAATFEDKTMSVIYFGYDPSVHEVTISEIIGGGCHGCSVV